MASAKDPEKTDAPKASASAPVYQATTNVLADGKAFAPGDMVDVGAKTLAQLIDAGAVSEV